MADRNYGSGLRAALWSLSQNVCYWPKPQCAEPTVRMVNKTPVCNLEIAHIRAISPGGPRYDAAMSFEQCNSFENLILLCHPHHVVIDGPRWREFPVELLEQWKSAHEKAGRAELSKLTGITEERLQGLLVEAFESSAKRVEDALSKFEQLDFEAAKVLRDMFDQLRYALDEGNVVQLVDAASMLRHSLNEGNVILLADAASILRHSLNEGNVELLADAASVLRHSLTEDHINRLADIAEDLRRYGGT